jgi:hypothetical protein
MSDDGPRTELVSVTREIRYGIANHRTIPHPLGGSWHPDEIVIRQIHLQDGSHRTYGVRTEGPEIRLDGSSGRILSQHWMNQKCELFPETPQWIRDAVNEARYLP